jgi:2-polyprenyl-3-methyl-5-hydroxy-6-metoxy-1,4-benzoquinol methylase
MTEWWQDFFDNEYARLWGAYTPAERTAQEVNDLWQLLGLSEGSRVLDAPCGYGRLSLPLAQRGATVLGVDQSKELLAQAERNRGDLPLQRLRYLQHDLRRPLPETGFDVALNIFSSLGYGTEEDDLNIVRTLRAAIRPRGLVLIETMHRDLAILNLSRGAKPGFRLPDGTLVVEETEFDAVAGRNNIRWSWCGPAGSGEKTATLRLYSATELVRLVEHAGLRFRSAHHGCSPEAFSAKGPDMGGRLGILATRE